MKNKEFYIECDGIKLHAKMDFPESRKEKLPCVIVVHGLTGHMEETHIKEVANACVKCGCAALRVELYGHGMSDGEFRNHTLFHWVVELLQIIDYVKKLDFVTDIYLTGHSQGGAAIVLAAGMKADCIKAIMPLSPGMMLRDAANNGNFPNTYFDPENLKDEFLLFGEKVLSTNYLRVCRALPFEDCIQRYENKVLIVHSDTDELVPYEYSVKLQQMYKNAELVTIFGDDHCYTKNLNLVVKAVSDFLTDTMNR